LSVSISFAIESFSEVVVDAVVVVVVGSELSEGVVVMVGADRLVMIAVGVVGTVVDNDDDVFGNVTLIECCTGDVN
jgi:hypothetical protein